jgi:Na+/H+ antiporter NhaD/arsenite permease-like protein
VDWHTIFTLASLMLITTSIQETGYLECFTRRIISSLRSEKQLALILTWLSALLSTFLTNDVALFVVLPLVLAMKSYLRMDATKLIVMQTIAVNVGSALTPIGNPQNLYLWHLWGISFFAFVKYTFPLFVLMIVILSLFCLLLFPSRRLMLTEELDKGTGLPEKNRKRQFFLSLGLLILLLVVMEYRKVPFMFLFLLIFFTLYSPRVIKGVDWIFLLVFILLFIDFHLLSEIPLFQHLVHLFDLHTSKGVFLVSVVFSQIMSNVPASIFLSKFTGNLFALTYGVNVGGNGFILGSFANLITLRLAKDEKFLNTFHLYSLVYLVITTILVYLICL